MEDDGIIVEDLLLGKIYMVNDMYHHGGKSENNGFGNYKTNMIRPRGK